MPDAFDYLDERVTAEIMRAAASAVGESLPPGTLFVVVTFTDPRRTNHISNCERKTIVRAMRETADRLEAYDDVRRN
jgi:hypothetical protein